MSTEKVAEKLKTLPAKPGVYQYFDANGKIIYVGKAINLRNRVRSYFHASADHGPKTERLVAEIADLEWIITDSELEALLLESNLIKRHKPRFNIRLKDDKRYPYIKVEWQNAYPKVVTVRKMAQDGARYYGPFTNAGAVYHTLDTLRRIFPYLTCDREITGSDPRACLYYDIKLCSGPCIGAATQDEYRATLDELCHFLEGKSDEVLNDLERKMNAAAEAMQFAQELELVPAAKPIDHIVAVVNEDVITRQELDEAIKMAVGRMQLQGVQIPDQHALENQVLESIITKHIQLQHAKEVGLSVGESELDETILRIAEENRLSLTEFYAVLEKDGISYNKFRDDIREEMIMARMKEREIKNQVNVTEGEVDNFLHTKETSAEGNDEYRLAHILILVPENMSSAQIQQRAERADMALKKLKEGAEFAQVAAEFSDAADAGHARRADEAIAVGARLVGLS